MKKYESLFLSVLAAMLAACSADSVISSADTLAVAPGDGLVDIPAADGDALSLQVGLANADTRAGTDIQTSSFPASSTVYVWLNNIKVDDGSSLTAVNDYTRYVCTVGEDGSSLTPSLPSGSLLRYPGPGSYPSAYGIKPLPSSAKFSVQTDQKSEANYLASDLVFSEKKTYQQSSGTLQMQFNHLLCKIVVVLQAGDEGVSDADLAAATVKVNARTTCTFDYPTQTYVSPNNIDTSVAAADITFSAQGACIIPPQGFTSGSTFIKVSVSGKDRDPILIPTPNGKTFEGGKQYTYTLKVYDNVWEVVLADVTVSEWTTGTAPTMVVDGKTWN